MRTNKTALLTVTAIALLSAGAYAAGKHGGPGIDRHFGGPGFDMRAPEMMIERMAEHLDLDDIQRESVENIVNAAKPEFEALREQFRANREALREMAANDPEIQNIAISNGEVATAGTLLFTRVRGEINAVLTDEQRAKLAEVKERRKERFERRKERR